MKKLVLTSVSLLSLVLLGACGKNSASTDDEVKRVGVLQLVEHESLDLSYEGFVEGLAESGYVEGENLEIEYQNAKNNQDNLRSMGEKLVGEEPDLLLGIATSAAQSLASLTKDIPIVVTSVTDLKEAKLVKSYKKPGTNITGTTNLSPVKKQIELLLSIVPDAKKVGMIYNSGEINSQVQIDLAKAALDEKNIPYEIKSVSSTNDVQQVTEKVASSCDAIYIPTDNTMASAATLVGDVVKQAKVPVVFGAVNETRKGGLASYGVDYQALGVQTGKMAAKILDGKAEPQDLPVEYADNMEFYVNKEMAEALGIDPASIKEPE